MDSEKYDRISPNYDDLKIENPHDCNGNTMAQLFRNTQKKQEKDSQMIESLSKKVLN